MSAENQTPDPLLEQAIEEIRRETVEDYVVDSAAARVWARLAGEARPQPVEHIRGCAGFQALIPDFRAGRLPEARATLFQDHVHECVACRKALDAASGKLVEFPAGAAPRRGTLTARPVFRWAAAAAVIVAAGLGAWNVYERLGVRAISPTIQAVNGAIYRVSDQGLQPLAAGAPLPAGVEIRTAKDSGAVLQLRDGSTVEMRERSGLSVSDGGADLTVNLARGSIIVQAAQRRSGHLYVATADCRVAVTGTVFSVSAGTKGSRVSVLEGAVRVSHGNTEKLLAPGQQVTTSPAMEPVPVRDDISWSRNLDKHLALLRDVASLQEKLEQVRLPDLRYSSPLTCMLPGNVVVFASFPNLGAYLAQSQAVVREKLAESPILREYWQQRGPLYEAVIDKLRGASGYLGDEVIMVATAEESGKVEAPVFLAEARRQGLADYLRQQGVPVRMAANLDEIPSSGGAALWMTEQSAGPAGQGCASTPRVVALSPHAGALRQFLSSGRGRFDKSPLGERVAAAYRDGAGLLVIADLERLPGPAGAVVERPRYAILEQKQLSGRTETRAALDFAGARPGIAAWLAAPAPIGALDYISPEASVVSAFAVTSPSKIVEEGLGKGLGPIPPPSEAGFDLKEVAASLGGEIAVAMDGPAFPTPSWKLVVEVYDPGRLQDAFRQIVTNVNAQLAREGKPPLRTSQETAGGRTYYMIGGADQNPLTEAHYVFSGGYLLMASTRAMLDRALQYRATGYTIGKSQNFAALVPHDRYANFSGVIYYNIASTVAPVAGLLGGMLSPEQKKMVDELSASKPTLIAVYGEPDRIAIASSGGFFGVSLNNLIAGNVFGGGLMQGLSGRQKHGTRAHGSALR